MTENHGRRHALADERAESMHRLSFGRCTGMVIMQMGMTILSGSGFKTPIDVRGRVRSEADGPVIPGPGLRFGQTRPLREWVLKPLFVR